MTTSNTSPTWPTWYDLNTFSQLVECWKDSIGNWYHGPKCQCKKRNFLIAIKYLTKKTK